MTAKGKITANIKVYIDTCIISGLINEGDLKENDFKALLDIVELNHIDFVASDVMRSEFEKHSDKEKRGSLLILHKMFNRCILYKTGHARGMGAYSRSPYSRPTYHDDPLFISIKKIFTQKDKDPEHIFQAIKNNCDYFLTVDRKSILNKAVRYQQELSQICPNLKFTSPVDLLTSIQNNNVQ